MNNRATEIAANYPITANRRNRPNPRASIGATAAVAVPTIPNKVLLRVGIWAKDGPLHSTQLHTA